MMMEALVWDFISEDFMGSADGNQMSLEHLGWLQLLNWSAQWEK